MEDGDPPILCDRRKNGVAPKIFFEGAGRLLAAGLSELQRPRIGQQGVFAGQDVARLKDMRLA